MFYSMIKKNGRKISDFYALSGDYFYLSPASLILKRKIEAYLKKYGRGALLDAGAGRLAYKRLMAQYCQSYKSMDLEPRSGGIDFVGDVQALGFGDSTFDTVFCSQVIEHLPEPWRAISEFRRVLRPGGTLILTAPHLSYLHNEPGDYYRFTPHGLKHLLERAGFKVVQMEPAGGIVAFIGHIFSTTALALIYELWPVRKLLIWPNKFLSLIVTALDGAFSSERLLPLNYLVAAVKIG